MATPTAALETTAAPPVSPPRNLTAFATYHLSDAGRKAALLAGLDARAVQQLTIDIPINRLHLVRVDAQGVARLRLRPQYVRQGDPERIVRIDAPPVFDVPPTVDSLFALAATHHELHQLHDGQRATAEARRADAERELRLAAAVAFLQDPNARAIPHPRPTAVRCLLQTPRGRRLFDVRADGPVARDVPSEALRRFRADRQARLDRHRAMRDEQAATHLAKKAAIADWLATHGSADQRARHTAGMLAMHEAIEAIAAHSFAAADDLPPYAHDGAARLQQHLRSTASAYADVTVAPADLLVTTTLATSATREQWSLLEHLQSTLPEATVRLRTHRLSWRADAHAPALTVYSVVVTQRVSLFTLRREYAAPGSLEHVRRPARGALSPGVAALT